MNNTLVVEPLRTSNLRISKNLCASSYSAVSTRAYLVALSKPGIAGGHATSAGVTQTCFAAAATEDRAMNWLGRSLGERGGASG